MSLRANYSSLVLVWPRRLMLPLGMLFRASAPGVVDLELMAASLAGMDMKSGSVDLDARMPPSAEATSMRVPADPVPAPVLEGWGPGGQHSVDAAHADLCGGTAGLPSDG